MTRKYKKLANELFRPILYGLKMWGKAPVMGQCTKSTKALLEPGICDGCWVLVRRVELIEGGGGGKTLLVICCVYYTHMILAVADQRDPFTVSCL